MSWARADVTLHSPGLSRKLLAPLSTARFLISIIMQSWTTQLNSQKLPTCSGAFFSRLASSAACFLYLSCVVVGFNAFASQTLVCCILRSSRLDGTIYDKKWVTGEGGAFGGLAGDAKVYPQLATMNHTTDATIGHYIYWPKRYVNLQDSPVAYYVQQYHPADIVLNTDDTNVVNNVSNSINGMFDGTGQPTAPQRAAINSLSVSLDGDDTPVITATTFPFGRAQGNSVSTADSSGNPIISYPDSTGYVPGYEPIGPDGTYQPVYYDLNCTSGGYALRLSNLESVSGNNSLTYDTNTGFYSLHIPDYSTQLTAIRSDLQTIANKEFVIDNIRLELPPDFEVNVPAPEVTVNPQVTVNPTVTVTPDVTVNVNAPNQNEIKVAIDNSTVVNAIRHLNSEIDVDLHDLKNDLIEDYFYASDFNTSAMSMSNEEQSLVDIANGWNTQIPVISNACDIALGAAFGNIPTIPPSNDIPLTDINVLGFNVVIDWSPYREHFRWLRAFCLMLEVVWFLNSLWKIAIQAMAV